MRHIKLFNKFKLNEEADFPVYGSETAIEDCLDFFRNKYSNQLQGNIFEILSDDLLSMFQALSQDSRLFNVNRIKPGYTNRPITIDSSGERNIGIEKFISHDFDFSDGNRVFEYPVGSGKYVSDVIEGHFDYVTLGSTEVNRKKYYLGKELIVKNELYLGFMEHKGHTSVWEKRHTIGEIVQKEDGKTFLHFNFKNFEESLEEIFIRLSIIPPPNK